MYNLWQQLIFFQYCQNKIADPFLRLDIENLSYGMDAKFLNMVDVLGEPDDEEDVVYDILALFCHICGATQRNIWMKLRGRNIDVDETEDKVKYYLNVLNLPTFD